MADPAVPSVAWSHVTTRLPIVPVLVVLAALTGVLAGCEHDLSSASSPSSVSTTGSSAGSSPPATASATGCPEAIADNTYVRAESARVEGSAVVVTADPAERVCEGPNNGHYEVAAGAEQLTVTSSATVTVLTTTTNGIGHRTVAATELPERLPDDRFGRIFLVQGPLSAVTSLEEQYHP